MVCEGQRGELSREMRWCAFGRCSCSRCAFVRWCLKNILPTSNAWLHTGSRTRAVPFFVRVLIYSIILATAACVDVLSSMHEPRKISPLDNRTHASTRRPLSRANPSALLHRRRNAEHWIPTGWHVHFSLARSGFSPRVPERCWREWLLPDHGPTGLVQRQGQLVRLRVGVRCRRE